MSGAGLLSQNPRNRETEKPHVCSRSGFHAVPPPFQRSWNPTFESQTFESSRLHTSSPCWLDLDGYLYEVARCRAQANMLPDHGVLMIGFARRPLFGDMMRFYSRVLRYNFSSFEPLRCTEIRAGTGMKR